MSVPIQIVDDQDQPIGQASRQEAWEQGLRHRIVRIMIENYKGEFLLQHRSPTKDIFPSCWDNSVAGHVNAGEDYITAANRELKEELGVDNVPLEVIGNYESDETLSGYRFKRFNRVYRLRSNQTDFVLGDTEVDGVRWVTLDEMQELVRTHTAEVTDGLRQVVEKFYQV